MPRFRRCFPGRWIKITIRDRGCGIPADQLPNIFDPYVTTKARGSGLGLTIAHNIVTKHDGYITVASEVGVGTTVALYLPASACALVSTPARPSLPIVRQETILVMDDDEAIRDVLVDMLTQLGYQSQCAREGRRRSRCTSRPGTWGNPLWPCCWT